MAERRVVLVSGATGRIGREVIPLLVQTGKYEVRSGHRRDNPAEVAHLPNPVKMVLDDWASVRAAVEGVDTIVHLAANAGRAPFVEEMIPNNIIGPYHLCEAALEAGCRRIIYASTNHAVYGYLTDHEAISEDVLPRPDSLYGVTKAYGEHLGRLYVERKGLPSYLVLRIGWFLTPDDPHLKSRWQALHMWLSPGDCCQLIERCIDAPTELGYDCFNAISDNDRQLLLIDHAKQVLGYQPEDNSERFVPEFTGELPEWLLRRRGSGVDD